ncbi:MAG: aromatic-ring-hydroxylating dioxygenase subunit beta [Alphaproteobacteria bacterium]
MNAAVEIDVKSEAEAFLIAEARLLDAGRFDEWLALFAEDGFYWVPAAPGQSDPLNHLSILYEDKSVLGMRVRRLGHPRVYSAQPAPRTAHLVGNVTAAPGAGPGVDCEVRSTVMMAEYRPGQAADRRLWAGQQTHKLRRTPEGWRIVLKRVDLIDCDAVHGILAVPI